ncbi:MAG TPA: nickel-dependent hydrogenase large subunit [Steroidobacteraceae bacterium]|nr:nickel-dependent hydrogenase large subunit [Steroidobacteraceae bacterium]
MDAGAVHVELRESEGRIAEVRVATRRPALAAMLVGRTAAAVAEILPLIYAVCAHAQGAAASAAIAAARGDAPAPRADAAVRSEAAGEQALTALTGEAGEFAPEARRAAHEPRTLRAVFDRGLFGVRIERWLGLSSPDALLHWAETTEAPLARECRRRFSLIEPPPHAVARLPALGAAAGLAHWPLLGADFARMPQFGGRPAETGPISRLSALPLIWSLNSRPLLQRWIARLVELARHASNNAELSCGRVSAVTVAPGRGRAAVETARGTLLHEIALEGERVADYVVVAPTEWNFHPDGPLKQWLLGMPSDSPEETRALAMRAVEALDPCVECRYTIAQ